MSAAMCGEWTRLAIPDPTKATLAMTVVIQNAIEVFICRAARAWGLAQREPPTCLDPRDADAERLRRRRSRPVLFDVGNAHIQ